MKSPTPKTLVAEVLACLVAIGLASETALAAKNVIDFDELANGAVVSTQYFGVTFSANPGYQPIVFSGDQAVASPPNIVCASDGTHCQGTLIMTFDNPVNTLSFTAGGFETPRGGVAAVITVHYGDAQVATLNVISTGTGHSYVPISLTKYKKITLAAVDTSPDPAGLGFDDIRFSSKAEIEITTDAPLNNKYLLKTTPAMPEINAVAEIVGATQATTDAATFTWTTELVFDASKCDNGPRRKFSQKLPAQMVAGLGVYSPTFGDLIMGGKLKIKATTKVDGRILKGETDDDLEIIGVNPSQTELYDFLDSISPARGKTLKRIVCFESGLRQFDATGCPLWSQDRLGGVGLGQITKPKPTLQVMWDWKANCREVQSRLDVAAVNSAGFPGRVATRAGFKAAVAALNRQRRAAGLEALIVMVPNFTSGDFIDDYQQLELDSLRIYNGAAGTDRVIGGALREFRLQTIEMNGHRVLDVQNVQGNVGTAVWERVPVGDRPIKPGDPNYVEHVRNCAL